MDVVAAVEGVDRAWHADRDLICVMGAVAPATLRDVLLRWRSSSERSSDRNRCGHSSPFSFGAAGEFFGEP